MKKSGVQDALELGISYESSLPINQLALTS